MRADRGLNGPEEKFKPYFLGGDQVALKAWNNKWVTCDKKKQLRANGGAIGNNEKFLVYTTNSKGDGLSPGEDYIALKSTAFNRFVHNDKGNWIGCNRERPGPYEKWEGWARAAPWNIDRVQFDLT